MTAEAEAEDIVPGASKKTRMPLIMLAGGALALLVVAAGLYVFVFAGGDAASADAHGAGTEAEHSSFIFNLPTMTVNLNGEGQGEAFMKLTIALEVADQTVMTAIQPKMAKVIDAFQIYLRELRKSDLEGSAGIYRLREELLRRVNIAIAPSRVESILFKEILVQ